MDHLDEKKNPEIYDCVKFGPAWLTLKDPSNAPFTTSWYGSLGF